MIKKVWETNNIISLILLPLSFLYFIILKIYTITKKQNVCSIPVICVGNITLGGAGKTPTVIEIRRLLKNHLDNIFVLTRGYKGQKKGPLLVNINSNANEVGDESLLHFKHGPTCVAKRKVDGAKFCEKLKSNLIIMDDGLQSVDIKKDLKILVIDGEFGFGNKKLLPSGPLREPIKSCIERADIIVVIDPIKNLKQLNEVPKQKLFVAKKKISYRKFSNKSIFVFSAIGNNKGFQRYLTNQGLNIKRIKNFSDHYFFKKEDIKDIIDQAEKENLSVVCTEKDFVKIPSEYKKFITPIKLDLKINESKRLLKIILNTIKVKKV